MIHRLTIRKSEDGVELPPRNLTLVVTVFKKACGAKDNYFRPCPNTQNCVRYKLRTFIIVRIY